MTTPINGGWVCSVCGTFVITGQAHVCGGSPKVTTYFPKPSTYKYCPYCGHEL